MSVENHEDCGRALAIIIDESLAEVRNDLVRNDCF
jgi:hypothetical protein